jgi:hypothetical protein
VALNLRHQTKAQFLVRLRARYRASERAGNVGECAKMAAWLYAKYQAGDVTAAQVRGAFELDTAPKWTAFLGRVQALSERYQARADVRLE